MLDFIKEMYTHERKQIGFMKHYFTLFSIIEGLEAKKTFEFGTGMSTRAIMEALKMTGGTHTSCDMREIKDTGLEMDFWVKNADRWLFIQKNSNNLSDLEVENAGPFDFVLHDGSHIPGEVLKDLKKIIPHMKKNSVLAIHDTFDSGMMNAVTTALKTVKHEMITLPYSAHLTLVRILDNEDKGVVSPQWKKGEKTDDQYIRTN